MIDCRQLLLDADDGGVRVAGIQESRRSPFVVCHHLLGVVEDERRGLVDWRRQRRRDAAIEFPGVNQLRGRALHRPP